MTKKITLLFLTILFFSISANAQYATLEVGGNVRERYSDSLKKVNYTKFFPILGKKAYQKGIDIPYPFGIMPAYYYQRQNYDITNISVALDDGELQNLPFIEFGTVEGITNALTIRPDIWILPFFNLYGLFGYGTTITSVEVLKPSIQTTQHFHGFNFGLGFTVAGAVGPVFATLDANFNWVKFEQLTKAVPATNISLRVGHTFLLDKPYRNVGIWIGPFYQNVQNDTEGEIYLSDVFDVDGASQDVQTWYDGLTPAQKAIVDKTGIYDKIENGLSTDHKIHYKLDKEVSNYWNMVIGFQYQHNKTWQFRTELGTFGTRTQFLITTNYRFM